MKEQYIKPAHTYTVHDPIPIKRTGMEKISVDFSLSEKRWIIANKTSRTEVSPCSVHIKFKKVSNIYFSDIQ